MSAFVKPKELEVLLANDGLQIEDIVAVRINPDTRDSRLNSDFAGNQHDGRDANGGLA